MVTDGHQRNRHRSKNNSDALQSNPELDVSWMPSSAEQQPPNITNIHIRVLIEMIEHEPDRALLHLPGILFGMISIFLPNSKRNDIKPRTVHPPSLGQGVHSSLVLGGVRSNLASTDARRHERVSRSEVWTHASRQATRSSTAASDEAAARTAQPRVAQQTRSDRASLLRA